MVKLDSSTVSTTSSFEQDMVVKNTIANKQVVNSFIIRGHQIWGLM